MSKGCIKKINNQDSKSENAIFVEANVVGLYPGISHKVGLKAFQERDKKIILLEKLLKMAEFALKTIISNLAIK